MSLITPFFAKGNSRQNSASLIFVEGQDDAYFLSALLTEIGADPKTTGIVEVEGKENFPTRLKLFLKSPSFTQGVNRTIAIVCDADSNPKRVETEINAVFALMQQPTVVLGEYVTNGKGVKIGLFTMPNPTATGDLESLCLDTVAGHPLEQSAELFMATAETTAVSDGKKLNGSRHKRKAQVFLAGMPNDLVRGAGRGYASGYFCVGHKALDPLKNFLLATIK